MQFGPMIRHLYSFARRTISFYPFNHDSKTYFCFDSLLCTGLTETSRNNGDPLGSALKTLLQRVHSKLCRDRNDDSFDGVRNLGGRLVNRLVKQLST